ncbi:AIPR family protein [Nodosilinea sp. PGN35]|uniref:AIPR family protein n=1 Tax=Nodosilinea sp. PGN35 TaxID=3020489 RepID=UPI0023B35978|nr:AIPR family protein [Nodosilinea sp. TSF1-S3]MDF0366887.1 AIPR family protein [Nodosilinea sp. TSF1-S3]
MTEKLEPFLPDFLQDYDSMYAFLTDQAIKVSSQKLSGAKTKNRSKAKGDFFENLASEVIAEHPEIELPASKVRCEFTGGSWEDGIDLIFKDDNSGKVLLYAQVKWSIKEVDHLDIILSKFESYYRKNVLNQPDSDESVEQLSLLNSLAESSFSQVQNSDQVEFAIITLRSNCDKIVDRYKKSRRSSKNFYDFLASNGSLHIINGTQVFDFLKTNLSRLCGILPDVELQLEETPIVIGNVAIGVISAESLSKCFSKTRESLFFENVRLFKGEDSGRKQRGKNREPVNSEILKTMVEEPEKMLSRNNGITFRAQKIVLKDDNPSYLFLEKASIVNGCQTTYMVVKAFEESPESAQNAKILIKIVETDSSWDVAEAANFQNKINQIDLKLAKYLRPQIAQRAGMASGINIEGNTNQSSLLEKLSSARASYEDVKILFLGLFSRSPGNTIAANYTEFRYSLLDQFLRQEQDALNDSLLKLIIEIQSRSDKVSEEVSGKFSPNYSDLFKRFIERGSYRAFLAITAGCITVRRNIYQENIDIQELTKFLESLIENKSEYLKAYRVSFMTLANKVVDWNKTKEENLKNMHNEVESAGTTKNFGNLLNIGIENFNQSY